MNKFNLHSRLRNHYARWNIRLSEPEQFAKFKNRLLTALNEELEGFLLAHEEVDNDFKAMIQAERAESPKVRKSQFFVQPEALDLGAGSTLATTLSMIKRTNPGFGDSAVYRELEATTETRELATVTQILFWALERSSAVESSALSTKVAQKINGAGRMSKGTAFRVSTRGNQAVVRPNGDPFLDSMIIDFVLEGIERYPKADKPFSQALSKFLRGDRAHYRNILDDLRFSLEQLLKTLLSNDKSLENQKDILGAWLKDKGVHVQIRSLYVHLAKCFSQYQNNAVKHDENYSGMEVEFMIYLTGTLMRLLLELEQTSSSPEDNPS
jgi:hypothetical protein